MKAILTLANGTSFEVEVVEPNEKSAIFTPSNDIATEKRLTDAMNLNIPMPLGIRVHSKRTLPKAA